ncbi:lysophospholipid acyltransferase family protein [Labrys wisconsinensis]|uniref:Hemolysin n=1 Tax=Labrys wisconsinensis TaxID=425677 RepID=A0ABU0J8T3_9HYPH|nr:lysophospholipid acyltransferase family protein [Labrys wisconsinensis]MDQ0469664.1 putative hemolysin [Labrys wisconsinensis]
MANVHFTYADPTFSLPKRALIRAIETVTGQPRLKRLYLANRRNPVAGESFFAAAVRQLELDVRFDRSQLAGIPASGPCVIVANHPYGVLDGVVIAWLIEQVRRDFVILTHALLLNAPEAAVSLLPVDFSETPEALKTNLRTRALARQRLEAGGCVIVFPAGAVSTSPDKLGRRPAIDAPWQPFTAQLIQRSGATVVPIFFGGQNSRLFQIASHVHTALRLSLIFKEVRDRIGTRLPVAIGDPIDGAEIAAAGDRKALVEMLRRRTYALAAKVPEDRTARRIVALRNRPIVPAKPQHRTSAPRV